MFNPIQFMDDQLLKGANAVVKTYNWTTGRTKRDLVNTANILRAITFTNSAYAWGPLAPIPVGYMELQNIINSDTLIKNEQKAREVGCLDMFAEFIKVTGTIVGPLATLWGAERLSVGISEDREYVTSFGAGLVSMAAESYLIRADYLPPRKNCVSRTLDKLTELGDKVKENLLQPQPTSRLAYFASSLAQTIA